MKSMVHEAARLERARPASSWYRIRALAARDVAGRFRLVAFMSMRYARFVLALAAAVAVGCGDAPTAETGDGPPASISLNPSTIEIFTKETQSLIAAVRDADGNVLSASVSWSSSNRSVAEVNTTGVVVRRASQRRSGLVRVR